MKPLDKAREISFNTPRKNSKTAAIPFQDQFELFMAWARGEITGTSVEQVLKFDSSNRASFYCWVTRTVKTAILMGFLVLKEEHETKLQETKSEENQNTKTSSSSQT